MRDSLKCDDVTGRELVGTTTENSDGFNMCLSEIRTYVTAWRDKRLRHSSEPRQVVFSRIDEIWIYSLFVCLSNNTLITI